MRSQEKNQTPARVLLVDDHAMFRWGVRQFFGDLTDYQLVGEASDGNEAIELVQSASPDMILLDLEMPHLDGIQFLQAIKRESPTKSPKVIILSQSSSSNVFEQLKQLGIDGYVLKTEGIDEIGKALEAASRSELYISPRVAAHLWDYATSQVTRPPTEKEAKEEPSGLSMREMQVARLIGKGLSNKEIAAELGCAVNTIRTHRSNLMQKIDAKNAVEIARWAAQQE